MADVAVDAREPVRMGVLEDVALAVLHAKDARDARAPVLVNARLGVLDAVRPAQVAAKEDVTHHVMDALDAANSAQPDVVQHAPVDVVIHVKVRVLVGAILVVKVVQVVLALVKMGARVAVTHVVEHAQAHAKDRVKVVRVAPEPVSVLVQ